MVSVLLAILKILGIILLVLLGIILVGLLLVLFVPVRYRFMAHRKANEETPILAEAKVTWLAHIFSVAFSYSGKACLKVKVLGFTVFGLDKLKTKAQDEESEDGKGTSKKKKRKEKAKEERTEEKDLAYKENEKEKQAFEENSEEKKLEAEYTPEENFKNTDAGTENAMTSESAKETLDDVENSEEAEESVGRQEVKEEEEREEEGEEKRKNKLQELIYKLLSFFQKIKYTMKTICDKIKHIVNNIQYYIEIIKSDTFSRTWKMCNKQVLSLLKIVLPRKVKGRLLIGTGDPASTGQVLAIYGILYPLLGEHIEIVPDFEQKIVEGDLLIKGKITAVRMVKIALVIFFNKDLRGLIKLFKREAV